MPRHSPYPHCDIPDIDIVSFVFERADQFEFDIAIEEDWSGRNYTYHELKDRIFSVSRAFMHNGLNKGDIICMYSSNCIENCPLFFGALRAGASIHLMKPFATIHELEGQFANCNPKFIITSSDKITCVEDAVKNVECDTKSIFVIEVENFKVELRNYEKTKPVDDLLQFDKFLAEYSDVEIIPSEDISLLHLSGGTTGPPKTIMNTHRNFVACLIATEMVVENHASLTGSYLLGYLPFTFLYPLVTIYCMGLRHGSRILVMKNIDMEYILKKIEEHGVKTVHLIPPQVTFLAKCDLINKYNLSSWRIGYTGGAPVNNEVHKKFEECMKIYNPKFRLYQGYGLTEFSGAVTGPPMESSDIINKPGSVGVVVPNAEVKILDIFSHEEVMAPHIFGEIHLRGPQVMKGYYRSIELTNVAMKDNWFRTGDVGKFDEDGFLYITDRLEDLIFVKGHDQEVIFPSTIETVLFKHPAVTDCAVVGFEGDQGEQRPFAFLVLSSVVSVKDIITFVNAELTEYEKLDADNTRVIEKIPRNPSKIVRRALRSKLESSN